MSTTNASADAVVQADDYDQMLDILDVAIHECVRKIDNGRVRKPENERVRVKQWRALAQLINTKRKVTQDRDLEELAARLEALEEREEVLPA